MRTLSITVLVMLLAACAIPVLAQAPAGPPAGPAPSAGYAGRMGGGMTCPAAAIAVPSARMVERTQGLELTDDQKTKINDAMTKGETALMPLREAAGKASRELRTGVMTSGIEAGKLTQLVQDAQKAEMAIIDAELKVWEQIRTILTADQLKKLQEQMAGRGIPRRGPGGNPMAVPVPAPAPAPAPAQ